MNFKMLKVGVLRLDDNANIPPSLDNRDWVEYQKWLALGNTPQPVDPDPTPIDFSNVDNIEKGLKALALCIAQVGGLSVPQMKVMFKAKWDSLP